MVSCVVYIWVYDGSCLRAVFMVTSLNSKNKRDTQIVRLLDAIDSVALEANGI